MQVFLLMVFSVFIAINGYLKTTKIDFPVTNFCFKTQMHYLFNFSLNSQASAKAVNEVTERRINLSASSCRKFFFYPVTLLKIWQENISCLTSLRELRKEPTQQLFLAVFFVTLEIARARLQDGAGDSPLGIPSGFARRGAGRLEGLHTSPAARLPLFGNLLDFVSAVCKKKNIE